MTVQILGFPNYSVSDKGVIYSKHKKGGALRPTLYDGYYYINLYKNGKSHTRTVHRVVLETFIGLRPKRMECRHLDGNTENNKLNNLCWGTSKENEMDKIKHGTACNGERVNNAKLTAAEVTGIRRLYKSGQWRQWELAEMFSVHNSVVSEIVNRKAWKHLGV